MVCFLSHPFPVHPCVNSACVQCLSVWSTANTLALALSCAVRLMHRNVVVQTDAAVAAQRSPLRAILQGPVPITGLHAQVCAGCSYLPVHDRPLWEMSSEAMFLETPPSVCISYLVICANLLQYSINLQKSCVTFIRDTFAQLFTTGC